MHFAFIFFEKHILGSRINRNINPWTPGHVENVIRSNGRYRNDKRWVNKILIPVMLS